MKVLATLALVPLLACAAADAAASLPAATEPAPRAVQTSRPTGAGFDHATTVAAARGSALESDVPHARRGEIADAGIARMFTLVDRLDYNRPGNEVVLTKAR